MAAPGGCRGEQEQAIRAEGGRVSRAIDVLRNAENMNKPPWLKALRSIPCSVPEVCAMQRACVNAYEHHLNSLESARQVRRKLKPDAGSRPETETMNRDLEGARQELERGRQLMARCLATQGDTKRRLGI
jgi:hypothetical protein